jgi:predicted hydrolase (HD superfamily)
MIIGMNREQALEILHEFTKSESLRKHALAVEACVRRMPASSARTKNYGP